MMATSATRVNHVQDLRSPHGRLTPNTSSSSLLATTFKSARETAATDGCTFSHNYESDFCAYHSTNSVNNDLIYAYIPVVDGCLDTPTVADAQSRYQIADAIISIVSHEQFEAVSNPTLGGWFDTGRRRG